MLDTTIIGAGPYGLSVAAHLRRKGIPFRIFGRPMDSWLRHMPKGMLLKSEGFASNISDPDGDFTLGRFCAEKGIEYRDTGIPVRLDTFGAYGLAFRDRMVPELEDKIVVGVDRLPNGFAVRLDRGETIHTRRVVLAVGITHFEHVPANLAHLPAEFLSHSARHVELEPFEGRSVIILGAGASALDLAGLLQEAGAEVRLIARQRSLKFHGHGDRAPSLWQKLRRPPSGLGPGWKTRFFSNWPMVFHYLPEGLRLEAVRRALGPSGGWFTKDKVVGRVPLFLGNTVEEARIRDGRILLSLVSEDGTKSEITADHVIAATGYKVDLNRLQFLSADIRSRVKTVNQAPVLASTFESSVPGLYFVGVAAANSFGPLMRFAFGARFAARTVTRSLARSFVRDSVALTTPSPVTISK
jgi:cation diffusion facilitator CzcD-associated flavoprotein CzcO